TGIPGGTVLWLDELKNYLDLTAGNRTAQQLLELLTSPNTPPIAIITTTWEADLAALATPPTPEEARAGLGAIHQLLTHTEPNRRYVPDQFTNQQIAALHSADPRIQQAAATAHQGRLIQVLGGGTLLLNRYLADYGDRYSPQAKSV